MNRILIYGLSFVMTMLISVGGIFGIGTVEETVLQEEILEEQMDVLYISSYSYSLLTVEQQLDGIRERFYGQPVKIDVEFLDTKRFNEEAHYLDFYEMLQYKLDRGVTYDAVLVGDDNGLQFLMDHRAALFPETPIFFLGINDLNRAREASELSEVTGVLEKKTAYETIELAMTINPGLERVILVRDNTLSSEADYLDLFIHEASFPELEFVTINTTEYTVDEFFEYIKQFDVNDMYVNAAAVTYIDQVLTFDEVWTTQKEVLHTPVYGLTTAGLGDGIMGGQMLSHEDMGYSAADMAMQYFHGTPIEEIPFVPDAENMNMIDFSVFEEFGFNEERIPEGTLIINRIPSFWEMYANYIFLAFFVFAIETLIIVALISNVRAKRKNAKDLSDSNMRVNRINAELIDTIQELNFSNRELEESIAEVNERDYQIKEMIYIDELTGLMTRYAIGEVIREITERKDRKAAIMLLDVDNFKNINDGFGHTFGDQVLRIIGERLDLISSNKIRISRFGGDEFVLVVKEYKSEKWLQSFVEKVQEVFTEPMTYENTQFVLTTSIGITKYPEQGKVYEELLKKADVALHYSKNSGKDTATMYEMSMDTNFQEKVSFQNLLRKAFIKEEFYLNFQPLVSIKEKRIYGFEALIRWRSDELGQVSPYKLITEAEEMGLIVKIGDWIFKQSFAFAEAVNKFSDKPISVSINISIIQLMYSEFAKKLIELFETYDLKAEYITLEMTETTLIGDIQEGKNIINELRNYGFKISLDDFGTGYSSLSYLKDFAIDVLKVDKSFIDHIEESAYDRYIVEAVLKIAKERNIATVAEGVETKEQYNLLLGLDCDSIQGYLFSKPLSLEDAIVVKDEDVFQVLD